MKISITTNVQLISRSLMSSSISYLFIILILLNSSTVFSQWSTQSPVPTSLTISGIGVLSSDHVLISTLDNPFDNYGSLYESTDGGNTWLPRDVPANLSTAFNGMFFLDSQYGWAFGNENYRTIDGGANWIQLPFLGSTYFMEFYTSTLGLTSGNFGIYISYDGGLNWVPSPNDIHSIALIDNQTGLGISNNGIFKTTNGGISFSLVHPGSAKAVTYLSDSIAIGIVDSMFVRTNDGGNSWTNIGTNQGKNYLFKLSSEIILAFGRSGNFPDYDDRIFRSTNGGFNWEDLGEVIPAGSTSGNFSFALAGQNIVATDGSGNMYLSTNLGSNWQNVFTAPSGINPSFFSDAVPLFVDSQTGYYAYGSGFIIKSTNGGSTWFQISSGTSNTLSDLGVCSDGTVIAVGENGSVLSKATNSDTWIIQETGTLNNFSAVQVLGTSNIVAVDATGKIYTSTDTGTNWISSSSIPMDLSNAEDLFFTDLNNGWIVGQGYSTTALFHTSDSGSSWDPIGNFTGFYSSIDVKGPNIWISKIDGTVTRSTDNGNTWFDSNLPGNPFQIKDIEFFNENIGYAVGLGCQAFRTSDGGTTWQTLPTPNQVDQLTDIYTLGPNELWVSTNSNTAYYTSNAGQNWAVLNTESQGQGYFSSIVANLSGDVWAAGDQGYIQHFAGSPPPPLNQPPNAAFSYVTNGLTVTFTDGSNDLDGTIVNWDWNFGDGQFSIEQNPEHTYDTSNTYIVWLKVTDNDGDADSTLKIITVQPNPGGTFGDFTEVTPLDSVFITPQDEDFWVITTAPADYDNDGDLDIAVLGYYVVYNQSFEYRLLLLVNNGPSSPTQWSFNYLNIDLNGMSTGESDMAWGDADGDGDLDLVVGSDGTTVLYRNNGGVLNLTQTILPGYWEDNSQAEFDLRSITWADFDNDSDLDLLIPSVFDVNSFSYKTYLMRNDGVNSNNEFIFTEIDSVFAPTRHASSTWADFDNDLDLDLLLVNMAPLTGEGFIKRYRNEGNGVFTEQTLLDSISVEHGDVQWGDYDNDGDLDIMVAGNLKQPDGSYDLSLRIYNNDNDNYTPFDVISCVPCEGWFDLTAATWADYDSDGDIDILLAGNYNSGSNIEGRARIYKNEGNGIFVDSGNELPAPRAAGDRGGTFSWLDLDVDGDLDYFIAGQYFVPGGNGLVEAQMHVYRNDAQGQNEAPSSPIGLNANVQNNGSVLLSWIASTDDHTLSQVLTYDIMVVRKGTHTPTRPDEEISNIFESTARLPEPGNVSASTEWVLFGLEDGLYDWMIKAVDAAYVGSIQSKGQFRIGISTSVENEMQLPIEYSLTQNYPNPFNPSTKIKYTIPSGVNGESKQSVKTILKIYDILGNEIVTLVNEEKPAGIYEIEFNASQFASGVYIYRLQAGNFIDTKKMTLMK